MKKLLSTLLICCFTVIVNAQTPQAFKYQSVVRDVSGNVIPNQNVSFRIAILQTTSTGSSVYTETHTGTTNGYGLINLEIGNGTVVSGNFSTINWAADIYFVQIELDATGGTNYQLMGTSQLLSVPYALNAKSAENVFSGDYNALSNQPTNVSSFTNDAGYITSFSEMDGDTTNELQAITKTGLNISLNLGGGTVSDSVLTEISVDNMVANNGYLTTFTEIDGDTTNELQAISISNDTVYLSNGGFVKLPQDQINDADADSTNELQALSISNDTLYLTNGGFVKLPQDQINDADADSTNELQMLSLNNDTLLISNGNSINLSTVGGNGYSKMEVFSNSGTYSWTTPAGVTSIMVEGWSGAGGGGGGGSGSITITFGICDGSVITTWLPSGGAGGNGSYGKKIINVTPNTTYNINVGSGGLGGLLNSNGSNGGNTSFDTLFTVNGGEGGKIGIYPNTINVTGCVIQSVAGTNGLGGVGGASVNPIYVIGGMGGQGSPVHICKSTTSLCNGWLWFGTQATINNSNVPIFSANMPKGGNGGSGAYNSTPIQAFSSGSYNFNCTFNGQNGSQGNKGALVIYY